MRALALAVVALAMACNPGAKYPARAAGCKVKEYPDKPAIPVDELGDVSVDCAGSANCGRKLMDEVCARGGDVVWGLGDNTLTPTRMTGHAAHSAEAGWAPREEGCDVQVFPDAPPGHTQNLGSVVARCDATVSDDACLRRLKDEACKLGGDVLWGVGAPEMKDGAKELAGRVAHTKSR